MYKLLLIVGFIYIPLEIIIYMPFKWAVWGLKSTNYTWDDRWYGLDIKINYRVTEEWIWISKQ